MLPRAPESVVTYMRRQSVEHYVDDPSQVGEVGLDEQGGVAESALEDVMVDDVRQFGCLFEDQGSELL